MSREEQIAIVQRFIELLNAARLGALDALVAEDVVDHAALPAQAPGLEGLRQHLIEFCHVFPSACITAESLEVRDEEVVWRWRAECPRAYHTGQVVSFRGINTERIRDGRIVEHRSEVDRTGVPGELLALSQITELSV